MNELKSSWNLVSSSSAAVKGWLESTMVVLAGRELEGEKSGRPGPKLPNVECFSHSVGYGHGGVRHEILPPMGSATEVDTMITTTMTISGSTPWHPFQSQSSVLRPSWGCC